MDQKALVAAYERYHQQLYRFCFSILGNAADAEDALQNAMVKALRALPGEERQIQLKPWLYRVAHNESVELLRRRRDEVEADPALAAAAADPAEAAERRQRLRRLFGDLAQLPERQRGALVMRELAGLGFDQIGEAFDTSPAVARQTVYEARLGLRQMEAGREMSCDEVTRRLSSEDGRLMRRRDIRAHLRTCPDCRAFGDAIAARKQDMAALAPLPAAASAGLLQAALGGAQSSAAGAGLSGTVVAEAGKAVAGSALVKSAATAVVVVAIGASAADRGGLIDVTPGGGSSEQTRADPTSTGSDGAASFGIGGAIQEAAEPEKVGQSGKENGFGSRDDRPPGVGPAAPSATTTPTQPDKAAAGQLPDASRHGQETAASHGGGRAHGQAQGQAKGTPHSSSGGSQKAHGHPSPPPQSASGGKKAAPRPDKPPTPPAKVGADNPPSTPLQPSKPPKSQGATGAAGGPSSKEAR